MKKKKNCQTPFPQFNVTSSRENPSEKNTAPRFLLKTLNLNLVTRK